MANSTKDIAKKLGAVPLFSKLKSKHRVALAEVGKTIDWADGKEGVREGTNASAFFLILEGAVSVSQRGTEISTMSAGDFFGEIALLSGGKRTATVTATAPTRVFAVGRAAVTPLIKSNPDFALDLIQAMAARQANDIV